MVRAMRAVTHYAIESWFDYVRGLGDAERRGQMAAHVAACPQCGSLASILAGLGDTYRADETVFAVPDTAFKAAVALFDELAHPDPRR